MTYMTVTDAWREYHKAGFVLIKVTSGLTPGFKDYDGGSPLIRVDHHGNVICTPNLLRGRLCSG